LNIDWSVPIVRAVPSTEGALREASHGQDGMRRPARCLARNSREAPETRPPPLRADALWSLQTVKPDCFIPRGTGSHKPRGGAPRGERSRWNARRARCACGPTSLARRRVPLHPSACRRSAPLGFGRGKQASLGGYFASRERSNVPSAAPDPCYPPGGMAPARARDAEGT
jgi:hypothetical protein